MSVCSAHQTPVDGCTLCLTTPAMVLGCTEEEWDVEVANALASGIGKCQYCGFDQFRNHYICAECGVADWEARVG